VTGGFGATVPDIEDWVRVADHSSRTVGCQCTDDLGNPARPTPDRDQSLCRIRRRFGPVINHYLAVLLQAGRLHPHSRSRLGSHEHRLFGGETQSPHHELPDMTRFPPRLHNSRAGVSVRPKQQMTELVGYDATQNYWDLELGMVALGATHRILVIDSGENRMDSKTEDSVFVLILDGHGKQP
jgi:hypothetical protein